MILTEDDGAPRSLWSTQHLTYPGPGHCCAASPAWPSGLCCAAQIPWPEDKCNQRTVMEDPVRQLHLHTSNYTTCTSLAFTWKCSKKVSWEHCSFLTVEKIELFPCFPRKSWMTKRKNIFYWWCLPSTLQMGWKCIWCYTSWGSQHLKGYKIIYAAYSIGPNKQHCEWYLIESEFLSYCDHNWPAASSVKQYLMPTFSYPTAGFSHCSWYAHSCLGLYSSFCYPLKTQKVKSRKASNESCTSLHRMLYTMG